MIHPNTEIRFINQTIGYGVVATQFIPKGTITWALDKLDRSFTSKEVNQMDPLYRNILDTYSYRNREGDHVLCWDNGRFVNHSFNSNCISTAYDFEIAVRDIHEGEQLTDDYGYLNISAPFQAEPEGGDRRVVYPDDLIHFHEYWDTQLEDAMKYIFSVEQPLKPIIPHKVLQIVREIIDGKRPMDSILSLYCGEYAQN